MTDIVKADTTGTQVSAERSVTEIVAHITKIQEVMDTVLKEGEHYGPSFPGDKKKNLLKPGIDKLAFTFRLIPEYDVQAIELQNGHREYRIATRYRSLSSGEIVGEGLGSCSTMEGKYRWRNAARKCPECGKEAIIKGKAEFGGGWVCYKKKDGCGVTFDDNDPQIVQQECGKIENPDIADVYNTVLKIAKKRSSADAIITALAVSDIFSQDADDLDPDDIDTTRQKAPTKKQPEPPEHSPEFRMKAAKSKTVASLQAMIEDHPAFTDEEILAGKKKLVNLDRDDKGVFIDEKNALYLESVAEEYRKKLDAKVAEAKERAMAEPVEKEEAKPASPLGAAVDKLKTASDLLKNKKEGEGQPIEKDMLDIF